MEDEIDLIINILKNKDSKTTSDFNIKDIDLINDSNHRILKPMPNVANMKYTTRIEIDGGVVIKENIKSEKDKEREKEFIHASTWKKESKFLRNFYNK